MDGYGGDEISMDMKRSAEEGIGGWGRCVLNVYNKFWYRFTVISRPLHLHIIIFGLTRIKLSLGVNIT